MNCISDELIQKYVDGEVPEDETVLIRRHLNVCKSCADRVEARIKTSENMKSAINSIVDDIIEIPAFEPGEKITEKPSLIRKPVLIIATLAAAAFLVLFIIVFRNGKKTRTDGQISSFGISNYEFDANQPISRQPLIIHVAGPDGKKVDYIIE